MIPYVKSGGVWRRAQPFIKDAGAWKRPLASVRSGGVWNDQDVFITNFSEYTVGAQPSDWSARWVTTGYTALVQSVAGSLSGKALRFTKTSGARSFLSWDRVPAAANVEILIRARAIEAYANNDIFIRSGCRASGAGGAENGYVDGMFGSTTAPLYGQQLAKYTGGTAANIGATTLGSNAAGNYTFNTWAWMRFRINGNTLSSALWIDGSAEPATAVSATDTSIAAGGWNGLAIVNANPDVEVDFFSIALNGKTAFGP